MKKENVIKIFLSAPPYIYSIITFLIILYLTLMPDIKVSSSLILIPYYDKVIHLIMFGFFAAVMVFDYFRRYKYINRFQMFICGIISMLIGGVIEIIQEKMNMGRAGEWMDFIADCSGALIFAFISGYFCNRWIEIKN